MKRALPLVLVGAFLLGILVPAVAPPDDPTPAASSVPGGFAFAAAGDFSFGSNLQPSLDRLATAQVDFLVGLGDLSYGSTTEQNFCQSVKAVQNEFVIVAGNHDSGESGGGNINNYVQHCPYNLPGALTGTYGKEYWFDYPATSPLARFLLIAPGVDMVVDGAGTYDYSIGTARYNFVRDTIDAARTAAIPWVVVGMHKNCITTGSKGCEIGEDLFNLLLDRKVDLVLEGHDHNVQRSKQLSCPAITVNGFDPLCVVDDGADDFYQKGAGLVLNIDGAMGQCCYGVSSSDSEAGYFAKIDSSGRGFYKYTVTAGSLVAEFIPATGTFTDLYTVGGTPPVQPLAGSFTVAPANPRTGMAATFTATASGGEPPYSFSWAFGDATSSSGNPAVKSYSTAGTYTATLTVTDGGGNVTTANRSMTVSDPPPAAPDIRGWGGVRISEASTITGTTPSNVFTGEMESHAEATMRKLVADGYTGVRLYFESPVTQSARVDPAWEWDATWFARSLDITIALDLWAVVDLHGYCDWLYISASLPNACTNPDPGAPGTFLNQNLRDPWVTWWRDNLVVPYKDAYAKILWQPLNEPIVSDASGNWPPDAALLAPSYQVWIDMARTAGDTHWIAVSNANWNGDFPTVTDPLNRIVLDRHWYFFYDDFLNTGGYLKHDYDAGGNYAVTQPSCASWGTACAEAYADDTYAFILKAETQHGRPHISLELGALDTYGTAPPDQVGTGECVHSPTSLAFLTRLIDLYETSPAHGYVFWPGGDWAGAAHGCMEDWGALFVPGSVPDTTPPTLVLGVTPGPGTAAISVTATDDDAVTAVSALISGPNGLVGNLTLTLNATSGNWEYVQAFPPGSYTITVWARDPAGNWASGSGTFLPGPAPDTTPAAGGDMLTTLLAFLQNPLSWLLILAAILAVVALVVGRRRRANRKNAPAPSRGAPSRASPPKSPSPESAPQAEQFSDFFSGSTNEEYFQDPEQVEPFAPSVAAVTASGEVLVAQCGSCEADVPEDATNCPSCGTRFA